MNREEQLRLQAFLDGELPAGEARDVAARVQGDGEAAALLAELKRTRETLADNEPQPVLAESREFFWSQVRRRIEQGEAAPVAAETRPFSWRHLWWPAGAIAACFLIVFLQNPSVDDTVNKTEQALGSLDIDTPVVEAMQPNSDATTYRDDSDGTTLVWFSVDDNAAPAATF